MEEGGGAHTAMAISPKPFRDWCAYAHEQQMIREWADGQGEQNREIKRLLERIGASREELTQNSK